MPSTARYGFRYPAASDAPNVPLDMQHLAEDVEGQLALRGIIARSRRTSPATSTTATTQAGAQKVVQLDATTTVGRLYRVSAPTLGVYSSAAGQAIAQLTYTTDGTAPTVTSTLIRIGQRDTKSGAVVAALTLIGWVAAPTTSLKVLLSYYGGTAGTYTMHGSATDWPIELMIEDVGVDPGTTGTNF